ncbi:MORN repeat-containing protein [Tenacibaculum sp. M341]|uniref:MORN repeat-containing protein n=1 Tax=Tenacibaculum sp. M341 TaxID=2530339 RepID=UPI00104638AD|nr:hypothetical protein [Tenacibaculum sp. M341]TCI93548.1 hypothetical protein EYW44_03835 [Tenacibaculum sp. M341]
MKLSKTLIIFFTVLLIVLMIVTISGKANEYHLQKQLVTLEKDYHASVEKINQKNSLVSIDSMLIKGEYETALNAYEEQFSDSVVKEDKDYVQFRIKVAKQFMDLEQKSLKRNLDRSLDKNENKSAKPNDNNLTVKDYDSVYNALLKTKKQLYETKNKLGNKSFMDYLTFKSSKKDKLHYVGQVIRDKANGYGIAVFDTGSRYEGIWRNNKREGKGKFYWADGERYEGDYKNDRREGEGVYYWTNGEKYKGGWKNDKREGKGVFYNKKGKIVAEGIWKKDKLVEEEDEENK